MSRRSIQVMERLRINGVLNCVITFLDSSKTVTGDAKLYVGHCKDVSEVNVVGDSVFDEVV